MCTRRPPAASHRKQQKALRQKSSHHQRARKGRPFLGGSRPFGYDKDHENHTLVVREDETKYLREAYRMLLAGINTSQIAAWLNSNDVRTAYAGKPQRGQPPRDRTWNHSSVRQVLMALRNGGILMYNGQDVGAANWTGIVPERQYRAAVRLLNDASRRTSGPRMGRGGILHFLVGLAVCGECGGPVRGSDQVTYTLYACRKGHVSARADWMEAQAAAIINNRVQNPLALRLADSPDALTAVEAELEALEEEVAEYEEAKKAHQITFAQFLTFNAPAQTRLKQLRKMQAQQTLSNVVADLLDVEDVATHWDEVLTVRERANTARAFFDRIEIVKRGKHETGKVKGRARF